MSKPSLNRLRALYEHPLILPIYVPSFILSLSLGVQTPILPLYVRELGASYQLVGLVLSGQAIGMLLSDIPSGMTIRRLGGKRTMVIGLLCAAISSLALVWAGTIPEALIYRLLTGIGISLFGVARHTYIAERVIKGSRGRAVATLGGIFRIGRFAGPAIGGIIANEFNLRAPFLLVSGLTFLAFLVVIFTVPPRKPIETSTVHSPVSQLRQLKNLVTTQLRTMVSAGAGQLCAQMVRSGPGVIIPLYAADVIGLDVTAIGWIMSIGSAIDMTLFYPVGVIMDRLGRKFAIVPSFFLQGIGLAFIPLTNSFGSLGLVACLIGLGNGLGSGTMLTLGADLAPEEARGEFLGIWRLIGDTGFTLGPLTAGWVAGVMTLPLAAIVMASSGFLGTIIFVLLVPETNQTGGVNKLSGGRVK